MTNQVDIGVLRGLHAASTQGEWKLHKELCKYGDSDAVAVPNAKYGWCLILSGNHNFPDAAKADAAWAVAAHNALPALLDELERLRELLDRATETMIQARGALAGAADERGHGVTPSAAIQAIDEELIAANLAIKQGMMEQLRDRQVVTHPLHPDPWVDAVARFEAGTAKIAAEGDQAGTDGGAE